MDKKRVISFVDGFNLYHAIHYLKKNHLKWQNIISLSEAFIKSSQESLIDTYFFSAYAPWRESSFIRHKKYTQALEAIGVKCIMGNFKEKKRYCNECKHRFIAHEEKETDVNIAIHLLDLAYKKAMDKVLIITSDSDLCPIINMLSDSFKEIEICVLVPPNRYPIVRQLRNTVPTFKIKEGHLENNLLPERVFNQENSSFVEIPDEYKFNEVVLS